jgi:hypothetical protein
VLAGRVTLDDCYEAALMLDWREHCEAIAEQASKER